jgi:hypothetical protein
MCAPPLSVSFLAEVLGRFRPTHHMLSVRVPVKLNELK